MNKNIFVKSNYQYSYSNIQYLETKIRIYSNIHPTLIGSQNIRYNFLRVGGDVKRLFCRNVRRKINSYVYVGLSGVSRVRRPGSERRFNQINPNTSWG